MSSDGRHREKCKNGGEDGRQCDNTGDANISLDRSNPEQSHQQQPWFWSYTTRDEAERRLAGQPDGTFLIRDCSVPGDFTLTVREAGGNKCVRIYRRPKGYSLSPVDPEASFSSLGELVEFYRHRSLATFNRRLDVCLRYPLVKPVNAGSNQYGVFKELYDLSQDQLSAQTRLSVLQQQKSQLDQKARLFELMLPALRVVQQMYYKSMRAQEEWMSKPLSEDARKGGEELETGGQIGDGGLLTEDVGDAEEEGKEYQLSKDEERSITANARLLLSRHSAMSDKLHGFKSNHDAVSIKLQNLDSELKHVELTLLLMKRRQEELVRQMMEMGCKKEYLSQVLESRVATREFDRSTWLRDCSREEAQEKLKGLPHGAFLIRHKDKRHLPFVLSIVISGENEPRTIQHCYIVRPHGRGYGFNAALAVFQSLDQLVLRHRHVSLRHYFKHLDVMLTFPVGCQELLHRSASESEKEGVTMEAGGYANAAAIQDAIMESVYEPVESQERGEISVDVSKGNDHRCGKVSSGNVHSSDAAVVRDSGKKNECESVESSTRHVSSETSSVLDAAKEHKYETLESPRRHGVSAKSPGSHGVSAKSPTRHIVPSKRELMLNLVKEHNYEYVASPSHVVVSKTADVSSVAKEHKYEPVGAPDKSPDASSRKGNQETVKEPKSDPAEVPGTRMGAVRDSDYHRSVTDHKYETISSKTNVGVEKGNMKEDENVYELVSHSARQTTV